MIQNLPGEIIYLICEFLGDDSRLALRFVSRTISGFVPAASAVSTLSEGCDLSTRATESVTLENRLPSHAKAVAASAAASVWFAVICANYPISQEYIAFINSCIDIRAIKMPIASANIFLDEGRSLLDCAIRNKNYEIVRHCFGKKLPKILSISHRGAARLLARRDPESSDLLATYISSMQRIGLTFYVSILPRIARYPNRFHYFTILQQKIDFSDEIFIKHLVKLAGSNINLFNWLCERYPAHKLIACEPSIEEFFKNFVSGDTALIAKVFEFICGLNQDFAVKPQSTDVAIKPHLSGDIDICKCFLYLLEEQTVDAINSIVILHDKLGIRDRIKVTEMIFIRSSSANLKVTLTFAKWFCDEMGFDLIETIRNFFGGRIYTPVCLVVEDADSAHFATISSGSMASYEHKNIEVTRHEPNIIQNLLESDIKIKSTMIEIRDFFISAKNKHQIELARRVIDAYDYTTREMLDIIIRADYLQLLLMYTNEHRIFGIYDLTSKEFMVNFLDTALNEMARDIFVFWYAYFCHEFSAADATATPALIERCSMPSKATGASTYRARLFAPRISEKFSFIVANKIKICCDADDTGELYTIGKIIEQYGMCPIVRAYLEYADNKLHSSAEASKL